MHFLDTETCGYHGPVVLIQWAVDKGPVNRLSVWREPIIETLRLIEQVVEDGVCGFNLTFDWFHLQKLYNCLVNLGDKVGFDEWPVDHIGTYAALEADSRLGVCIKPKHALDLMLIARKGKYQSTMDRKDIRIKRVPIELGYKVVERLDELVDLPEIYFAKSSDKTKRWQINPTKDKKFVNIELKFKPSSALKVLVRDALGVTDTLALADVGVSKRYRPIEVGWAPFATAISSKEGRWFTKVKSKKGRTWPALIERHIDHWTFNHKAIRYAENDVLYLQQLYDYFDQPPVDDDDSVLACMVGSVRWRGFEINLPKIEALYNEAVEKANAAPKHSTHVKKYLEETMEPAELAVFQAEGSTAKVVLERIAREWKDDDGKPHQAAVRAAECLQARKSRTDAGLFKKLLIAKRFHVSLKVIGALSSRMSGTDGLNATGIQHSKKIRSAFTLGDPKLRLCGGDFSGFEVSIADARYNDPELRKQLLTCFVCKEARTVDQFEETYCPNCGAGQTKCGNCKGTAIAYADGRVLCACGSPKVTEVEDTLRKIHGLFGMELAPGNTYEEILATKGSDNDLYDKGKRGIFSQLYGGNEATLVNRGVCEDEEIARSVVLGFATRYQGVGQAKLEIHKRFCSMKQEGIGKPVYWDDPAEYVESLTGFRRYFTLENRICKELYDLANNPPKEWLGMKIECIRRDRVQKVGGAVRSALFAAAFQIQAHNMRAAANHEIQSTGATLTKRLQARMWSVQPYGCKPWQIAPFNIHDEIMAPCREEHQATLQRIVREFIVEHKKLIPLIKMDFALNMNNWSEK
jgi:hypothetical protein